MPLVLSRKSWHWDRANASQQYCFQTVYSLNLALHKSLLMRGLLYRLETVLQTVPTVAYTVPFTQPSDPRSAEHDTLSGFCFFLYNPMT